MSQNLTNIPVEHFLSVDQVVAVTSLSRASVYRLMKAGRFPKAKELMPGGRRVGWAKGDVFAWIRSPLDWS